MCGSISIEYNPAYKHKLREFFTDEEIKKFEEQGEFVFSYWDRYPVLPVRGKKGITFVAWGNRDATFGIPRTGWARLESLRAKKWDHLQPRVVLIPAKRGCEKKHWFNLEHDIKAVLIQKEGIKRIYIITEAATAAFKKMTGHDRMPRVMKN